jgi:acid stress-induced BolA-like protein IbaG/YrbA
MTPMTPEHIEQLIKTGLPNCDVSVEGDGAHFEAIVVSSDCAGKTRIQKQQMVYATVNKELLDGSLHALSIKAFTPEEWQAWKN